jgi:hypothetical protein
MSPRLDYAGDDPSDRSAWFNQGDTHICLAVASSVSRPKLTRTLRTSTDGAADQVKSLPRIAGHAVTTSASAGVSTADLLEIGGGRAADREAGGRDQRHELLREMRWSEVFSEVRSPALRPGGTTLSNFLCEPRPTYRAWREALLSWTRMVFHSHGY